MCINYACLKCIPKSSEKCFVLRPEKMFVSGTAYSYRSPYDELHLKEHISEGSFNSMLYYLNESLISEWPCAIC